MNQGIKVQHLYNSNLEEIVLAVPKTIEEQKQIATVLFSIAENITEEERFRSKLYGLRRGLMEDLLTGVLRVNHLLTE